MMNNLSYRNGSIDDIEPVFALNQRVFDEAWSKQTMLQSLQLGYDLFVCFHEDNLIAYVLSQDILLETQIMQVCVHQDFRWMGVGKMLMQMLMQFKQDSQAFLLEVRKSNLEAQSFYTRLGFTQAGLRPNYYSKTKTKPREDAVVMTYLS